MKPWLKFVAAGIGLLAAAGVAVAAFDVEAEPPDEPDPMTLCSYLNGHFADFDPPIDAADAKPLAVLDSPNLGVAIDRIERGLPPDEDPLVNAVDVMAGFYTFPVQGLGTSSLADRVTIPAAITDDYNTYARALHSAVYEGNLGVRDDQGVREAAEAVDAYIATCDPPLGHKDS